MDYCTYKFYDEKGRRLAIFADLETNSDGAFLYMYVVTCSDKDKFTKKRANLIYRGRKLGGSEKGSFAVKVIDNKPKKTFIIWCKENFYKREIASFVFEGYVLTKGDDVLPGITPCSPITPLAEALEGFEIVEVEKEVPNGV